MYFNTIITRQIVSLFGICMAYGQGKLNIVPERISTVGSGENLGHFK
jgi:hypothetical protein